MISVWELATFSLSFLLLILICYHAYYRINIRHITNQLKEIINNADTNQLLTIAARQKDMLKLVNQMNALIKDTRWSRIKMNKMNRSFRESITSISHDLRTPLTTANGYIQILQTIIEESESQEYLNIILERQTMVQILLNQLFEYVRIESGDITYEMKSIDAKQILIDTLAMYYDEFNKKGEEPTVDLPEPACIIQADEQGIRRIFTNILYNAIVHGDGDYHFEVRETTDYVFLFSNASESMTEDDLEHIFDRFYTKEQSRNKKTTGLGLAIAKEITKQMNGTIKAYHNNGQFTIAVSFPRSV